MKKSPHHSIVRWWIYVVILAIAGANIFLGIYMAGGDLSFEGGIVEKSLKECYTGPFEKQQQLRVAKANTTRFSRRGTNRQNHMDEDVTTTNHQSVVHRDVQWFDHKYIFHSKLFGYDYFSASWLMPRKLFLQIKQQNLIISEDAVHQVKIQNQEKVRMSADWMDFSVEHMSKWWKMISALNDYQNDVAFNKMNQAFLEYTKATVSRTVSSDIENVSRLLHPTIAIVAFNSYGTSPRQMRLTISALGATLASMARVGFGRIVVVGLKKSDEPLVWGAVELLTTEHTLPEFQFINIQNATWSTTKHLAFNIPRAAVIGLQNAFRGKMKNHEAFQWLGKKGKNYWKYVYLTEPDTLLQTRQMSLKSIHDALEDGMVLIPHRFQPIPHYIDLVGFGPRENYLQPLGVFKDKPVIKIRSDIDSCCDEGAHPVTEFPYCGNTWFTCGFTEETRHKIWKSKNDTAYNEKHKMLIPYDFIQINGGTEIVSLAGSNSGRSCRPEKFKPGFVCKPPTRTKVSFERSDEQRK